MPPSDYVSPKIEKQWTSPTGLECLILAQTLGFRCGYVRLPDGHPLIGHKIGDEEVEAIDVHGGVTFLDDMDHVGLSGHWIGFDCGHAWDGHDESIMSESIRSLMGQCPTLLSRGTAWDTETVAAEVERLAEQVAMVKGAGS